MNTKLPKGLRAVGVHQRPTQLWRCDFTRTVRVVGVGYSPFQTTNWSITRNCGGVISHAQCLH